MKKFGEDFDMFKYTIMIDGMQCGMCEAHINDAIRKNFPVKKISSSHRKKQTVIVVEKPIEKQELQNVINNTGYTVMSISQEPYEKKGLFHR